MADPGAQCVSLPFIFELRAKSVADSEKASVTFVEQLQSITDPLGEILRKLM
jgi:hypothetical protein